MSSDPFADLSSISASLSSQNLLNPNPPMGISSQGMAAGKGPMGMGGSKPTAAGGANNLLGGKPVGFSIREEGIHPPDKLRKNKLDILYFMHYKKNLLN